MNPVTHRNLRLHPSATPIVNGSFTRYVGSVRVKDGSDGGDEILVMGFASISFSSASAAEQYAIERAKQALDRLGA
jgi:hypothetical protein